MKTNEAAKKRTRVKFDKSNEEQIELGVKVLVAAYNSSCKHKEDAVKRAMNKLTDRDSPKLPKVDSFVRYLSNLKRAMVEQKSPVGGRCGWTIVVKKAYDELTGSQMSVNDIKTESPAGTVSVTTECPQEDLMEQDAEQAREEEGLDELPFDDTPIPEDFDIWQSDAYSFLTSFCHYSPDGNGTVTMSLKAFEMLFRRHIEGRSIA